MKSSREDVSGLSSNTRDAQSLQQEQQASESANDASATIGVRPDEDRGQPPSTSGGSMEASRAAYQSGPNALTPLQEQTNENSTGQSHRVATSRETSSRPTGRSANFREEREIRVHGAVPEDRSRASVPSVISARNSTSLNMSALTTSTASTSTAGLTADTHIGCEEKRTSLDERLADAKGAAMQQLIRGSEEASTGTCSPGHEVENGNAEEQDPTVDPIEPELVVARRVSSHGDSQTIPIQSTSRQDTNVIEPDPELILVQANPAKVEDSLRDLLKSRRGRLIIFGFIVIVASIAAGLAIGIERSRARSRDDGGSDNLELDIESYAPSRSPTNDPTATPSALPSSSPTWAPSTQAPTTELEGYLVANNLLPNYTIPALRNSSSPQSKALQWVERNHDYALLQNLTLEDRLMQRFALATLYYATNGFGWQFNRYWLSNQHECLWWSHLEIPGAAGSGGSQQVCNEQGHYVALLLDNNALGPGTLPPELALLTHLEDISLLADSFGVNKEDKKSRYLVGGIPSEYGFYLSHLKDLDVSKNALSSTIPSEIGLLSNSLEALRVLENNMTGPLPTSLSKLTQLKRLYIYDNAFTSSLPTELGLLTGSILDINAIKNKFVGTLPSELGLLTQLTSLSLQENQFVSTIPREWGDLEALEWLLLKHNKLTGSIPEELGNMKRMRLFYLEYNNLSGTIPSSFGGMRQVTDIGLNNNRLTGTIPSELGLCTKLMQIDLQVNMLEGSVPSEVCSLPFFGFRWAVSVDCNEVQCECGCCTNCC